MRGDRTSSGNVSAHRAVLPRRIQVVGVMSSISHIMRCCVLAVGLAACTVPDADESIAKSAAEPRPIIQGADGPLSPAASAALLARLGASAEGSEILQRHLKVEEAVAGSPLTAD